MIHSGSGVNLLCWKISQVWMARDHGGLSSCRMTSSLLIRKTNLLIRRKHILSLYSLMGHQRMELCLRAKEEPCLRAKEEPCPPPSINTQKKNWPTLDALNP